MDPLLTNSSFIAMARSTGRTPEEHLASLSPEFVEATRKILLGVKPETPAPVLESGPASRAGEEPGVLMRNEQNLVQENIGERQLLEGRIADLEGSVDTQADVARLQQMQQQLIDLGGSVESNQSTPQYDEAAQIYLQDLRQKQEQAAAVAPDVRAAEAEIASSEGLLSSGTLPPEMQASIQARQNAAQAALTSATTGRDARVADVTSSTLTVENPVNGLTAQSLGVLQANPNEQPGADPAMSSNTAQTPNPSNGPYLARPVLEGSHRMPDGSIMPNSEMSNSTGPTPSALQGSVNLGAMEGQYSNSPVLTNPAQPLPKTAALTSENGTTNGTGSVNGGLSTTSRTASGGSTGNARGSNMAYSKIDNGESLIRIGGAMYSGALQGNGIGAATQEYGKIQDANRVSEAEAFAQAEATRVAELRARSLGTKAGSKEAAKNSKALDTVNDAMWGLQSGLDAIAESRASGGNLTGIGGIFKGVIDNFTGDPDANRRMILSRLRVDDALLRVAETKGAISNAEMKLFLSPAPKNFQDERVWVDWLNERMSALQRVQGRLQGGVELGAGERANQFGTYGNEGSFTVSPAQQAAMDKYLTPATN